MRKKINFIIYDYTTLLTNNYNTHLVKYLTKKRGPGSEIWSKNFSSKFTQKMKQGD